MELRGFEPPLPSACHAPRVCPRESRQVWFPQLIGILGSEIVVLNLAQSVVVVTLFVTGYRTHSELSAEAAACEG